MTDSKYLWLVATAAALTGLHFGYFISVINVPQQVFLHCAELQKNSTAAFALQTCFPVSNSRWGFVGGAMPIGGLFGGLLSGPLVKQAGLRSSILWLNVPLIAGYLLMALATSLPALVGGRFMQGIACGASGVLVPLYLTQVAPVPRRGVITAMFQLFLVMGVTAAELLAYAADVGRHEARWRFTFGAGLLVCLVQLALAFVPGIDALPQTPNELREQGRTDESLALMQRLGHSVPTLGHPKAVPMASLSAEQKCSDDSLSLPPPINNVKESALALLTGKIRRANKSLLTGIIMHVGQQVSGINAIFFYSVSILDSSSSASQSITTPPSYVPTLLTAVNLVVTLLAIRSLSLFGRRPVLLASILGSGMCLLLLAVSFSLLPSLVALPLLLFIAAFAIGLGPIPWMATPEIFPSAWHLTPTAISTCVTANWLANSLVTLLFPWAREHLSKGSLFGFFAVACLALFIAMHSLFPETRDRPATFI